MKKLLAIIATTLFVGCTVNSSKLSQSYAKDFANNVTCAVGHKGTCFCFIASRKTGDTSSTGIGMTIDQTGRLCE